MKTIKTTVENEIEIKNSRFIAILYKLEKDNTGLILEEIKKKYPKANHYCYAYRYNDTIRISDDGEPSGTAGMPIRNVLEKEDLNNVLAIVVRYFGGIKLGAGGLVRAYTKSITEALKIAEEVELVEGYKIHIEFPYTEEKQINYILGNSQVIEKEYKETVNYTVLIEKELFEKLQNYPHLILDNIYIEKKNS